jgi:hypothetical protein
MQAFRIVTLALASMGCAMAQEKTQEVPLPPKPSAESPSLENTLDFIRDKLAAQGVVSTIHTVRNTLTGKLNGPWKYSWKESDVSASACNLSLRQMFHWPNPEAVDEYVNHLSLRDVERLVVTSIQDEWNRDSAKKGEPEAVAKASPPVWVVEVYMSPGKSVRSETHKVRPGQDPSDETKFPVEILLHFQDEQLAQRIAKALTHAVELCGGGGKELF